MAKSLAKDKFPILKIIPVFLIFLGPINSFSQDVQALLMEPEFSVVLPSETLWSFSFGLANRAILLETLDDVGASGYDSEHIELNHFTTYQTGERSKAAIGMRYRFREMFNSRNEDEIRLIEQFAVSRSNVFLGWSHRGRFEQRFRASTTIFRLRYRFGLSKPLSETFSLQLSTEALYSMSRQSKPEPEQRFALGIGNTSFDKWSLNLGLEYRTEDYLRNPDNDLYILTGATLKL